MRAALDMHMFIKIYTYLGCHTCCMNWNNHGGTHMGYLWDFDRITNWELPNFQIFLINKY